MDEVGGEGLFNSSLKSVPGSDCEGLQVMHHVALLELR